MVIMAFWVQIREGGSIIAFLEGDVLLIKFYELVLVVVEKILASFPTQPAALPFHLIAELIVVLLGH